MLVCGVFLRSYESKVQKTEEKFTLIQLSLYYLCSQCVCECLHYLNMMILCQ